MRAALALLLASAAAAPAAPPLAAGFAEVDVTPTLGAKPVFMAGFGHDRRAKSVHDPIMVRAVVLSDGTTRVALVSVDVVGLFFDSAERVRAKLPGFQYVLVCATHNHEGPDTLGLWGASPFASGVDPDYLARVEAGCVEAVTKADATKKPAVAKVGAAADPSLLRDSRLPDVKHDELVAIQFLDPATQKLLGVLVQWNNHPEVLDSKNTAVTADFPGYTVGYLRKQLGCPVAYFTGTVGGLMTTLRLPVKDAGGKELADGTFEKAERYGELVGKLAEKALAAAVPATLTPFDPRSRQVLVPVQNNLYLIAGKVGTLKRPMYEWVGNPTPTKFTATDDVTKPVAVRTEVGLLRLGELDVAVIPGEIYPELVLGKVQTPADPGADFPDAPAEPAVYAQMTGKFKMIVGLGNDELGYIIPKRQWDAKKPFCYGLPKAQYGEENSTGPDAAPVLCEAFRALTK